MPTSVRIGLGSASIGSGLLQGEVTISESVETLRLGTGIELEEQDELVTARRISIGFSTSDIATGLALVNGVQLPQTVSFAGAEGGSWGISGVLTSAEYAFTVGGIAVCRTQWEALNGEFSGGGGGGGGTAESVVLGLGTIGGGGLLQSVSVSASGEFQDQMGGRPAVLKERIVKRASAKMTASFAEFGPFAVGAAPADVTFLHNSGASFTVLNAVVRSVDYRYTERGIAVQNVEWSGTGLTVA